MASFLYTKYKASALTGAVDLTGHTIKVMLVNGNYAAQINSSNAQNTHFLTGDVVAYEIADGGGYIKGGKVLTSKSVTADTTDKEGVFDADDVSWPSSTITASGAVIYVSGSINPLGDLSNSNTAAAINKSYLIAFVDFGGNQSSSNGTFQIVWNNEGIINWS
jgi:hypothetical protein